MEEVGRADGDPGSPVPPTLRRYLVNDIEVFFVFSKEKVLI